MQQWRIEDLDPPDNRYQRVVDPIERIGIVVIVVMVLLVAAGSVGDRIQSAVPRDQIGQGAATSTIEPTRRRATPANSSSAWRIRIDAGNRRASSSRTRCSSPGST